MHQEKFNLCPVVQPMRIKKSSFKYCQSILNPMRVFIVNMQTNLKLGLMIEQ